VLEGGDLPLKRNSAGFATPKVEQSSLKVEHAEKYHTLRRSQVGKELCRLLRQVLENEDVAVLSKARNLMTRSNNNLIRVAGVKPREH